MENIKVKLARWEWLLKEQVGVDFRKIIKFPLRFIVTILEFTSIRKSFPPSKTIFMPCIHDRYDFSGQSASEYFLQDLFMSTQILKEDFKKSLLDIGSRMDGYIANIASSRNLDILDIRPGSSFHENVHFIQGNLFETDLDRSYDIISCLHTVEHFGLGRYGDPIGYKNFEEILQAFLRLMNQNGTLYLSTPISNVNRLFLNAHYLRTYTEIKEAINKCKLIVDFEYILCDGEVLNTDSPKWGKALDEQYSLLMLKLQK